MRALLAVVLAGCFSPAPRPGAPCASNRDCPDGLTCFPPTLTCEKPGREADVDACPAVACDGDNLVGCGDSTACAYGCGGETPHCFELAPSNGITVALLAGVTADVAIADLDFDTDDGSISATDDAGVTTEIRAAGPGVIAGIGFEVVDGNGVFSANSWNIIAPDDTDATGGPPFVLFARTTIAVSTTLDAGGAATVGGPGATNGNSSTTTGGCRGRAGRSNTAIGAAFGEGGGGGGGVTAGGDGGPSNQATPTGIGGTACSAPDTIPLRGGNAGGHGGQASGNGGGGGGGAVMLVAMESIDISGAITVPGAGGLSATTGSGGGGGGGAGGAILLEAPIVNVTGSLTANGGAGGAPAGGTDGARGSTTSRTPAVGGALSCVPTPGATPVTRRGGSGAAGTTAPTDGATCTVQDAAAVTTASQGGGGGGALGRIHIRRHTGAASGTQSPTAVVEDVTFQ